MPKMFKNKIMPYRPPVPKRLKTLTEKQKEDEKDVVRCSFCSFFLCFGSVLIF